MEPHRKKRKSAIQAIECIKHMSLGKLVGHVPKTSDQLGYFLLRSAIKISTEEYNDLVESYKPKNLPIFNYSTSHASDGKRLQSNISTENLIFKRIRFLCKNVLPKSWPNNPVIITSLAGCQEQAPHCDWNVFEFTKCLNLESAQRYQYPFPFFSHPSHISSDCMSRVLRISYNFAKFVDTCCPGLGIYSALYLDVAFSRTGLM